MPGTPSAVYAFPTMAGADAINQIDEYSVALGSRLDTVISAVPQQAWQTIALTGFASSLSYYKDSLGIVHFRGDAVATTASPPGGGATLCTLPAGYRPGAAMSSLVQSVAAGGGGAILTFGINISTAGVVTVATGAAFSASIACSFGLTHFRAEN